MIRLIKIYNYFMIKLFQVLFLIFFDEIIIIDQFLIHSPIPKEEFLKKIKLVNNPKTKK